MNDDDGQRIEQTESNTNTEEKKEEALKPLQAFNCIKNNRKPNYYGYNGDAIREKERGSVSILCEGAPDTEGIQSQAGCPSAATRNAAATDGFDGRHSQLARRFLCFLTRRPAPTFECVGVQISDEANGHQQVFVCV